MSVPDRSLLLLNEFGITFNQNEMMGIKLHDGLYDDSNKPYFRYILGFKELIISIPLDISFSSNLIRSSEVTKILFTIVFVILAE